MDDALASLLLSSRIMTRTTIDIDAPVLEELKRLQEKEGASSLGALASSLIADALAARKRPSSARRLRWNARSMQPRVSIEDKESVWAILDEPNDARRE
jgi:hypothetical protein